MDAQQFVLELVLVGIGFVGASAGATIAYFAQRGVSQLDEIDRGVNDIRGDLKVLGVQVDAALARIDEHEARIGELELESARAEGRRGDQAG